MYKWNSADSIRYLNRKSSQHCQLDITSKSKFEGIQSNSMAILPNGVRFDPTLSQRDSFYLCDLLGNAEKVYNPI